MKQTVTAKQRAFCQRLTDPEFEGDVGELCRQMELRPATFYKWWDDPNFRAYLQLQVEKFIGCAQWSIWRALIKKCRAGDVSAIKLYFEMRSKTKQLDKESYSQLFQVLQEDAD